MQGPTSQESPASTTSADRDRKIASLRWLAVVLGSTVVVIVGLVGLLLMLRRGSWERGGGGGRDVGRKNGTPDMTQSGKADVWRESARRVEPMSVEDLKSQFAEAPSTDDAGDSKEGRS
ncbi:MAG: hypothetical protein AB7Q00_01645 [Phycisphaerales bacterium]|nr:MAG: hypothetical protein IPK69_06260 [Phycisphaerales bacterium]